VRPILVTDTTLTCELMLVAASSQQGNPQ